MAQQPKILPNNIELALAQLCNTPQHLNKVDEEKKYFQLYLNFAVSNIQYIAGVDVTDEKKIAGEIKAKGDGVIQKLANFLWLFNVDEPGKDFKDYEDITLMLITKIFALRNLFAHSKGTNILPLLAGHKFYKLLEGVLLGYARDNALSEGLKTDKLFKLKLMNRHSSLKETDILFDPDKQYELTRKGIIFLTCMALYKDEAMEFCQQFVDMKLPQRCPANAADECQNALCSQKDATKCNYAKAKALVTMFTYFSCRKGRDVLNAGDLDFMCFADIMTYLNKVPAPAMDYLPLTAEKKMLTELAAASDEIDKNKLHKYELHRRFKDRFLSFAAAYCEDFVLLPSIRFKRLDISETVGRKRYIFGSENDNRNRMDRHYVIKQDAIAFEFIPTAHYGDIKISSMRGTLSEAEFKNLLFTGKRYGFNNVNDKLHEYLSAYHRILEKMLNAPADEEFYLDDFEEEFAIVTGVSGDELYDNFAKVTEHCFPENLTRFFVGDSGELSQQEMYQDLQYRLKVLSCHASDFLKRLRAFNAWRKVPKESRTTRRPPVCAADKLNYAPYTTNFSDGDLIAWVFRAFNLHLAPENKFRQLSRGEQHNDGIRDHEYQLLHAAIGKYSLDQKGLTSLLTKYRSELSGVFTDIQNKVNRAWKEEQSALRKKPEYDANGRLRKATKTLAMLAEAAAMHCLEYYRKELTKWESCGVYGVDGEVLRAECRRFKVKVGMPLDRNSLIKTILGIDENKWSYAYNYAANEPFRGRTLASSEHIFTKVPIPNGFASRSIPPKALADGNFDFHKALREMKTDLNLRNYYDVSAMVEFLRTGNNSGLNTHREIIRGDERIIEPLEITRNTMNKAHGQLRKYEYQDKLLVNIALEYRKRFMQNESMFEKTAEIEESTSIYSFYDAPVKATLKGGIKLSIYPNDLLRPAFALIRQKNNLQAITAAIDPSRKEFTYYELQEKLRMIQAEDRRKRLEILPQIFAFENGVSLPETLVYSKKEDKKQREKENRDLEYPYYKRRYPSLTREEFDIIAETRNAVFHTGIGLDTASALQLLKKLTASQVKKKW